jgi:cell wall-associated NlpC family hydrolase
MKNYDREQTVEFAKNYLGVAFRHHFKPVDLCSNGEITLPSCMDNGMDMRGMDCSGLIIASICQLTKVNPQEWNTDYRHLSQMRVFETQDDPELGDAVTIGMSHIAIYAGEDTFIHASNPAGKVIESKLGRSVHFAGTVPLKHLLGLSA